jgi:hypothetical protein
MAVMHATAEEWRPIPGIEYYEVSDLGHVRSWRAHNHWPIPHLLSTPIRDRYPKVTLWIGGRITTRSVHGLVMLAFVGPRPPGMEVRHLDGDPTHSSLDNLVYGTGSENTKDVLRHGRHRNASRTHCSNGHLFDAANTYRYRGARRCRACRKAAKKHHAATQSSANDAA